MLKFYNKQSELFERVIADLGDNVTYKTMLGISESPQLYEIFSQRGRRSLTCTDMMSRNGYIKVYVPDLDIYISFTAPEYAETVNDLAKLKYKNLKQVIAPGTVSKFAVMVDTGAANVKKLMIEYFGTNDVVCEGTTCIVSRYCMHGVGGSVVNSVDTANSSSAVGCTDAMFAQFVNTVDPKCALGIRGIPTRDGYKYVTARDTVMVDDPAEGPYPTEYYGGEHSGSCLYFLQMNKPYTNCYKYGITDDIDIRLKKHQRKIKYWRVVKVFDLKSSSAMREAERFYKKSATDRGILAPRLGYTEVVQTEDHVAELSIIESIVAKCNV